VHCRCVGWSKKCKLIILEKTAGLPNSRLTILKLQAIEALVLDRKTTFVGRVIFVWEVRTRMSRWKLGSMVRNWVTTYLYIGVI